MQSRPYLLGAFGFPHSGIGDGGFARTGGVTMQSRPYLLGVFGFPHSGSGAAGPLWFMPLATTALRPAAMPAVRSFLAAD